MRVSMHCVVSCITEQCLQPTNRLIDPHPYAGCMVSCLINTVLSKKPHLQRATEGRLLSTRASHL